MTIKRYGTGQTGAGKQALPFARPTALLAPSRKKWHCHFMSKPEAGGHATCPCMTLAGLWCSQSECITTQDHQEQRHEE